MKQKLRQITDTVHQTVYLSEMESEMMSTAYFYRLHDVYQSSTVYMTFPCNRTKRYEHSYGTMAIAGEIFYSSITNADEELLTKFFAEADDILRSVILKLLSSTNSPTYCASSFRQLRDFFPPTLLNGIEEEAKNVINTTYISYQTVEDSALNHFMPPFSTDFGKRRFLYQCLLEAVRIAALFHDIGHPPYSHIMESVLDDLYLKCKEPTNNFNKSESATLVKCLERYKESRNDNISCLLSEPQSAKSALHEQVGLTMLERAFEDIFHNKFYSNNMSRDKYDSCPIAVYYLAVAEFCFAILRDQTPFFTTLHRIIDGTIDADRMDYVVRDTINSGVDWGVIPYKRLVDSCKLVEYTSNGNTRYCVAFQRKMAEDIEDILITRYKIFSRINYHHRSYKTSLILQRIVKKLSENYLYHKKNVLCPGIADLWNCLSSTMSAGDLYIIQWNDSTLTSHLAKTLADMKRKKYGYFDITEKEYTDILSMLDEFLLNHKHFYSVFKRQADVSLIFKKVFTKLKPTIDEIIQYEQAKYDAFTSNEDRVKAEESLKRVGASTLNAVIENGDADALMRLIPIKESLEHILIDVLKDNKEKGQIRAYVYDYNKNRIKTGLPKNADPSFSIFLYGDNDSKPEIYNTTVLSNRLIQLQSHCLEFIAYVEPEDMYQTEEKTNELISSIRDQISDRLYNSICSSLYEMFSVSGEKITLEV